METRQEIYLSLKTDSLSEASSRADAVWREQIEGWELALAGQTSAAHLRYDAARRLAQRMGYRYVPQERLIEGPVNEVLDRLDAATDRQGRVSRAKAEALLGVVEPPRLTVSEALETYWVLAADRTAGKTEDQIRRWRNPRKKAIGAFIEAVGDLPLDEISRDDMLDFRDALWQRVRSGEVMAQSANKDITYLTGMLRLVSKMRRMHLDLPLDGLMLKAEPDRPRPPFSTSWIKDKILAPGALAGLNTEARCILLGMVNTGYRPSEGAALKAEDIRLDTNIPHIHITGRERRLKTPHSDRMIPLAGISLEAFRACPEGFPRYFDKPGLTATVNKYLRERGLLESEAHTLYGLRHSFEDRLLDAGVDERMRRDLMGHALNRERYGAGARMEKALEAVQAIAL